MPPMICLLLLEDTPELTLSCDNHICLYANDASDMSALVRQALRLRPDRIIVGEVRGAEALDLIDALSTGHSGGLCTLHAGSIEQALMRLVLLISRHKSAPRLIEPFLTQALDLIVILKTRPVRHIADIACVTGYDNAFYLPQHSLRRNIYAKALCPYNLYVCRIKYCPGLSGKLRTVISAL